MNDTLKTIAKRYSCRDYKSEMPSDEQLTAIANAAIESPSGINRQAWRIIVVKNSELIADMEKEGMAFISNMEDKAAYNRIMSRGGALFYHTPCLVMIAIDPTEYAGSVLDCGIVCENIALAATSLGLGNVICGMAGLAFTGDKTAEFKKRLGFPEGFEFGSAVLIGYANTVAEPHTPDKAKISFVE